MTEEPGSDSLQRQETFLLCTASKWAQKPTQSRIYWIQGALSLKMKRQAWYWPLTFIQRRGTKCLEVHLSTYLSIYLSMALQSFVGPWSLFNFLILYTVGCTDSLDGGSARQKPATCTDKTPQTQNIPRQTFMPRVGFEPMILVFERAKTVHTLDSAATVIGHKHWTWLPKKWTCFVLSAVWILIGILFSGQSWILYGVLLNGIHDQLFNQAGYLCLEETFVMFGPTERGEIKVKKGNVYNKICIWLICSIN
jgi:hypothetical protein